MEMCATLVMRRQRGQTKVRHPPCATRCVCVRACVCVCVHVPVQGVAVDELRRRLSSTGLHDTGGSGQRQGGGGAGAGEGGVEGSNPLISIEHLSVQRGLGNQPARDT